MQNENTNEQHSSFNYGIKVGDQEYYIPVSTIVYGETIEVVLGEPVEQSSTNPPSNVVYNPNLAFNIALRSGAPTQTSNVVYDPNTASNIVLGSGAPTQMIISLSGNMGAINAASKVVGLTRLPAGILVDHYAKGESWTQADSGRVDAEKF